MGTGRTDGPSTSVEEPVAGSWNTEAARPRRPDGQDEVIERPGPENSNDTCGERHRRRVRSLDSLRSTRRARQHRVDTQLSKSSAKLHRRSRFSRIGWRLRSAPRRPGPALAKGPEALALLTPPITRMPPAEATARTSAGLLEEEVDPRNRLGGIEACRLPA